MASLLYGGVLWVGDSGLPRNNEVVSKVALRLTGAGPLDTFVTAMLSHTKCLWRQKFYNEILSQVQAPPGVGANVDVRAIIYYRDPTNLEVFAFEYPAPVAGDVEDTGVGKRIKDSVVTSIVGYISTMTGISYAPLYGIYMQKV